MYIMKPECNLTITRVIRRYTHTHIHKVNNLLANEKRI